MGSGSILNYLLQHINIKGETDTLGKIIIFGKITVN
jgi:hypothetical protein